ncbi:Protein CHROMATIN REMODELING 20 [Bienertia sinuspersici]
MEKLLNRHRLRWIMNFHEHETLLQENEEEKLTKEEQDLAWEVFRRSMNGGEVQKPPVHIEWQESNTISALKEWRSTLNPLDNVPSRYSMPVRKCTNISHLYTLKFQGTKVGCSTVCGECGQDISWEDLNSGRVANDKVSSDFVKDLVRAHVPILAYG